MTFLLRFSLVLLIMCASRMPILYVDSLQTRPVTLIFYSDYQSAICREAWLWLRRLSEPYPDKIRIVTKHFPTPDHPQAFLAARAAFCATSFGRFREYHELLFTVSDLREPMLLKYAVGIGLDEFEFEQCLESDVSRDTVNEDREEAIRFKLSSPPIFILDQRILVGVRSVDDLLRELQANQSKIHDDQ